MSYLKAQVSFPFLDQYSVQSNITPYTFLAQTFYTLIKSSSLKCKLLRFLNALVKICPNPHIIFQTAKDVFLQILHDPSVFWKVTPQYLFRSKISYIYTLHKREQWKCKFWRLFSARIKIHQILVNFETTNCFLFKFFINIQCHVNNSVLFLAELVYTFNKGSLPRHKFGEIHLSSWNFLKILYFDRLLL